METIAVDVAQSIEQAPVVAREMRTASSQWLHGVQSYPPIGGDLEIADFYAQEMLEAKRKHAQIEARRVKLVAPLRQALAEANKLFREPLDDLAEGERILKGHIAVYEIQRKAAADAKQRELDAIAEAERERLTAEAAEEEHAARALLHVGKTDDAFALTVHAADLRAAASMVPIEIAPEPEKLPGVTMVMRWVARVVNKRMALAWIGTHEEYDELVEFRQSAIDAQARSLKAKMRIPGIEAVQVPTVAGRTKP